VKLNDVFERIVVINLDRRPDRLAEFDEQAKSINLKYERHSAFDAEGKLNKYNLPMRPSDACMISHSDVINKAHNDGVLSLLVFEDDANFVEGFDEKFQQVWSEVPDDWDLFYGGLWLHSSQKFTNHLVKPKDSFSAHCYGISGKALPHAFRQIQGKRFIDIELSTLNTRLNAYCAKPAIVYQRPSYSDLEREFRDVTDKYL
jgi:GR25 family glycosyltransferase involved in LPS biosynthesis